MRKLIKEQGVLDYKPEERESPTGLKIDLFKDVQETKVSLTNLIVKKVKKSGGGMLDVEMRTDPKLVGGQTFDGSVDFDCKTGSMKANGTINPPPNPNSEMRTLVVLNSTVYNKKLSDYLKRNFCSKDEKIAEGKKVVRLTENELVRLVKRVLKETEGVAGCPTTIKARGFKKLGDTDDEYKDMKFFDISNITFFGVGGALKMTLKYPGDARILEGFYQCDSLDGEEALIIVRDNAIKKTFDVKVTSETTKKLNCYCSQYTKNSQSQDTEGMA